MNHYAFPIGEAAAVPVGQTPGDRRGVGSRALVGDGQAGVETQEEARQEAFDAQAFSATLEAAVYSEDE